jgi:PEP-CTERM motif
VLLAVSHRVRGRTTSHRGPSRLGRLAGTKLGLLALVIAQPSGALSVNTTIETTGGGPVTVTVTEQFDAAQHLYARLYWTWCFADYGASSQEPASFAWDLGTLGHDETPGFYGWADLWNQQDQYGIPIPGTVTGTVVLLPQLPELTRLDLFTDEGEHETYWFNPMTPGAAVPEPESGLLMMAGLLGFGWCHRLRS